MIPVEQPNDFTCIRFVYLEDSRRKDRILPLKFGPFPFITTSNGGGRRSRRKHVLVAGPIQLFPTQTNEWTYWLLGTFHNTAHLNLVLNEVLLIGYSLHLFRSLRSADITSPTIYECTMYK